MTQLDSERLAFYLQNPGERLKLIQDIATRCYRTWDTWDIGEPIYGVQLAYLFATIAGTENWSFSLEMLEDNDGVNTPIAQALQELFPPDHAIWLFIDRQWNGLTESACPVCAHDCVGEYPKRHCYECEFDEAIHDLRTYKPTNA
jgi:hypothetical protein